MPRSCKSVAELKCLGTYRKDRHKDREPDEDAALIPSQPIGKPPEYFGPELVAIWDELERRDSEAQHGEERSFSVRASLRSIGTAARVVSKG